MHLTVSEYLSCVIFDINFYKLSKSYTDAFEAGGVYTRGSAPRAIAHCYRNCRILLFYAFSNYMNTNRKLSVFYTCHEKERWSEKFPYLSNKETHSGH